MRKFPLKLALLWVFMLLASLPCSIFGQVKWKEYSVPMPDSLKNRVRFGFLTVPETRQDTSNRTLKIGFCLLKSSAKSALTDAVIYLPGGPGLGNTNLAPYFFQGESINRILEQRDIILFDPRGCGSSEPQLCPGLEDPEIFNANLSGLSQSRYLELIGSVMRKCRIPWRSKG